MTSASSQRGFTLLELLVSMTVLVMVMGGVYGLLIQNSRINRMQQMTADSQSSARTCLSLVVPVLRSAGWDPGDNGIALLTPDPDLTDDISQITIFADFNGDNDVADANETFTIRHIASRIEWQRSAGGAWEILADNISNDSDGDGLIEPMFILDSVTNPTRITVTITANSALADPRTGDVVRYTVASDVILRTEI